MIKFKKSIKKIPNLLVKIYNNKKILIFMIKYSKK